MRIGPLARKLSVKPAQIVSFVEATFHYQGAGNHTRLNEEQVRAVLHHFKADALFAGVEWLEDEPEMAEEKPAANEAAPPPAEPLAPEPEQRLAEAGNTEEKAEVIKAPKIELQGLKVLGKIDLPTPRKKEKTDESSTPPDDSEGLSAEAPKRHERPRRQANRPGRERPAPRTQRTLTPAEQRDLEAKAEIEKRKKEAEQRKEQRAYRYLSQVNKKKMQKQSRGRAITEKFEDDKPQPPPPKTWVGKIWRWFTTG
ncbi:MAG: hypothetical protein MUC38_07280 [Cyclobacteriaceae bacterium]|jgi:hypothetical protein|nr:hypothetical protein [Cyclobacteriaceae bacterium]